MGKSTTALLAVTAILAAAAAAEASPLPAGFLASAIADFNVISNGEFAPGNDVVGPILVGGDLNPSNHPINDQPVVPLPAPIAGLGEVNVFGNVLGANNPMVGANSVVLIGGNNTTATFPGNNTALSVLQHNSFPYSFTAIWAQLNGVTGLSHTLSQLASPSTLTGSTFDGVANAQGVAVFNVPLATLNALTGTLAFTGCFTSPTPCDAVINVTNTTGTPAGFTQGFNYGGLTTPQQNVIWNFEGDTSFSNNIDKVTVNGEWFASILAPGADLENSAAIVGNAIANTVDTTGAIGEFHFSPFDCSDNLCTPTTVPEPGSLALLGGAIASFAALAPRVAMRRRRG